MFNQEAWDKNEWIESKIIQEHFNMTFSECLNNFGFNRQAEWNPAPLNGQKIKCYFRKYRDVL